MVEQATDEGGQRPAQPPADLLLLPPGGGPADAQRETSPQPPERPQDASQTPLQEPQGANGEGQPELSVNDAPLQTADGLPQESESQAPSQLDEVEEKKRHGILKHERTYSNKHVDFIEGVEFIPFDEEKDRTIEIQIVQEIRKVVSYRALFQKEKEEEEKKKKDEEEVKKRERGKGRRGGRVERGTGRGENEREEGKVVEALCVTESKRVNEQGEEAGGVAATDNGHSGTLENAAVLEGSDPGVVEGSAVCEGKVGAISECLVERSDVSKVMEGSPVGVNEVMKGSGDSEMRTRSRVEASEGSDGSGVAEGKAIGETVEENQISRTEEGLGISDVVGISQVSELVEKSGVSELIAGSGASEVVEKKVGYEMMDQSRVVQVNDEELCEKVEKVKDVEVELGLKDIGELRYLELSDSQSLGEDSQCVGMTVKDKSRTADIIVSEDNVQASETEVNPCNDIVPKHKSLETKNKASESCLNEEIVVVSFL